MTDAVKVSHWTQETRDALALADQAARLVSSEGLRRLAVTLEKGALKVTVEARR